MIRKSRILNVRPYLKRLRKDERFHIAHRLNAETSTDALMRAGFPGGAGTGTTLLPARIGPASTFNAEGRWIVHKDQPKELRFVRTIMWSWDEWRGPYSETKTEERDIYQECYPREWQAAPGIELTLIEGERSWVVTPLFANEAASYDVIKHAVNLMLELFGDCELIDAKKDVFAGVDVKRAHWRILPPGEMPWKSYLRDLGAELRKSGADDSVSIILDRQDTINRYEPDEIFVGDAGFKDYLAYVFKDRDVVVLESVRHGNALYVFDLDWQAVSRLTKAEIIAGGLAKERVIHSTGWKGRIQLAMPPKKKIR